LQALEEKQKISADNDITLWLAVLDYTISTFEDQLDFAAGPGKPSRPASETRTRFKEKSVNAIAPSTSHPNKLNRKEKNNEKQKPGKSNIKTSVSFEDTKDSSGMTCFNLGCVARLGCIFSNFSQRHLRGLRKLARRLFYHRPVVCLLPC